ncbi:DUF982 domain-containing protein [Phyllobacterium sp. 628]|uniref:DUF982 domain-containing protein n=1 Tax=Phyllobacterium sp. 628 TaxID=2718938 RepID=UPI00166227DF|nr:DUF982 domain-containing protein [Phyllobacterium sp. 628]QND53198.1 DUF982 domain-containing protein [Phyllobacterium sp. 628]
MREDTFDRNFAIGRFQIGTSFNDLRFKAMQNAQFKPVTVESLHSCKLRNIGSVAEAAEFLSSDWPGERGRIYLLARMACTEAMEGHATAAMARSVFVEATMEADIYVENTTWVR